MSEQAPDLTAPEVQAELMVLRREIGSKCYISAGISSVSSDVRPKHLLTACVYPNDILGKVVFYAHGETWRGLIDAIREAWAERSDLHAANTIREMALKIIAITADRGECTDAALRAEFDAADVARYGDQACEAATEMASNGPFSIVRLSGANDQAEAA